jgi:hypothetical protein
MGLFRRIFGEGRDAASGGGPESSQFEESHSTSNESESSRNAPRRELVQVILRDTMRKHGIPSDWIEARILSTISRSGRPGMHVNFVVRQAHDRLIGYVFAFQDSFENEMVRFEPRCRDWLLSIGWEFEGHNLKAPMPDPTSWNAGAPAAHAPLAPKGSKAPVQDLGRAAALGDDSLQSEGPKTDEDIQRDLEALFAIRDAAMADAAHRGPSDPPDFEPTQPFDDSGDGDGDGDKQQRR